jgi:hypothetical protein
MLVSTAKHITSVLGQSNQVPWGVTCAECQKATANLDTAALALRFAPASVRAVDALLGEPAEGVSITVGGYSLGDLLGVPAAAAASALALGVFSADAGTAPAAANGLAIGLLLLLPPPKAAAYQRAAADP